tara:strand:- start:8262 stop:10283 length:2022 start_codon:yes stop_codon:yes gene_type:complete
MSNKKHTNLLINQSSSYLLQHAHNPVNWHPWNRKTLKKAEQEDKLILISIGYSACHWCHVMEHETFEDEEAAQYMNDHFINIKVDREERPDIDMIYMNAVDLMTKRGGWPLNCIALPNGKPIWGGTYFPKEQWLDQIKQVNDFYSNNPEKVIEYAEKVTQGIQKSELVAFNNEEPDFSWSDLDQTTVNWKKQFDSINGGPDRTPKFPLPNNYLFLMRYAQLKKHNTIKEHVKLTLDKMAFGGIYDQIGGGFARYSVDKIWKVPHFEKMLYDNAQLISLYSEAYTAYQKPLYKDVAEETIAFVQRELSHENGAFYSALDADSEGEEGKFYIWKKEEVKFILGEEYDLFSKYYNVNEKGLWENDNYILLKKHSDIDFAQNHQIELTSLKEKVKSWKNILLTEREKRTRPGLDDKSITSWNALMCKAYTDAYMAFGNKDYLERALKNADFLTKKQLKKDGSLWRSFKNETSTINGYLEDYAFCVSAFIRLYEATFNEEWLTIAKKLSDYSIKHFKDENTRMLFFTSDLDNPLVARKMEINDNVIPGSCSEMANNLFLLGHFLENNEYINQAHIMLNNVKEMIQTYGSGYSNWANLYLNQVVPFYEIAIVGEKAQQKALELNQTYHPNKLLIGSNTESSLSLLKNKLTAGRTTIYVCISKSCQLPTTKVDEALSLIA